MIYDIPQSNRDVPGLEDYLRAIRERWQVILMGALLGIFVALAYDNARTATYDAEARVVINPTIANATNANLVRPVLEREREVMASIAVVEQALETERITGSANAIAENLEVSFTNDSDTLAIAYNDPDPDRSAAIVNAVANSYVSRREDASITVYTTQIESLRAQADTLNAEIEAIGEGIGSAQSDRTAAIARPTTDTARQGLIEAAAEQVSILSGQRAARVNDLTQVNRDLRAIERQFAVRAETAEVLQAARPADNPAGFGRNLMIFAGLLLGALAGAALAFTLQRLDRTAKGSAEIEAALATNVLGSIPRYGLGQSRGGIMMLSTNRTARVQRIREAYRRLRASLNFLQNTEAAKSFIITSARPSEGKSSTAANVAVAAAQAGSRVALISADLRRPMQESLFGTGADKGLSDYLNDPTITNIMVPVPDVEGLVLIPAGPLPPNPGELLGSRRFHELVNELADQFDTVLIDMPPVLSTADAGSAAPHVDGVLVVVDSQRTDTDELLRVRTSLERAGGTIVGAVLNKDTSDDGVSLRRGRYSYDRVATQR